MKNDISSGGRKDLHSGMRELIMKMEKVDEMQLVAAGGAFPHLEERAGKYHVAGGENHGCCLIV